MRKLTSSEMDELQKKKKKRRKLFKKIAFIDVQADTTNSRIVDFVVV